MKEIKCPFCGRENTRGKYCMFCGNPLAGGTAVRDEKATAKKEDGQRWDPETVYVQSRGRTIAILAAVIVVIACVAVVLVTQQSIPAKPERAFAAPIGTPGAKSLKEMTAMLKKAGMKPSGASYTLLDTNNQHFDPFVILDENTYYSVAKIKEGEEIVVAHVFEEERGKTYTMSNQGPVFKRLLEKLTEKYGESVIKRTQDYYYWIQQGDMLVLYYTYDGKIRLEFHEGIGSASV